MNFIVPLNLPKAPLKISKIKEEYYVFCIIRKKKLIITPEEWVRQHVIHYLINDLSIPIGRISSETNIKLNGMIRRCDIVVFDSYSVPKLIVECKSPNIEINDVVLHQIASYNRTLQVDYLMLTNGLTNDYYKIIKETGVLEIIEPINLEF